MSSISPSGHLNKEVIIKQGFLLIGQRQYDHAIKLFSDLLSSDPEDTEVLVGLACAYNYKKKIDQAIDLAERAIAINPTSYYAFDILAEIYFLNKNDYDKALEFANKSLEINPFSSSTFSLMAQIYYFKREYKLCFVMANSALEFDPNNYMAHMALGLYYYHMSDFNKAEEHYKACLALAPDCYAVYCNYGLLNMAFFNNEMGYKLLREAVKLNPEEKFLQETFREAYINNHIAYSPLSKLTKGYFNDVYLLYGNIVFMFVFAFISRIPNIPVLIRNILIILFLLNFVSLFALVIYRFIVGFIIDKYYSWAINNGKLSKII